MKRRRLWRVELAVEKSRCGDDGRWGVLGLWLEVDTEQESSLWMLCSLGPMQKLFEFHSPEMVWGEDLGSKLTVNRPRPTVPTNLQKKTVVRDILHELIWLRALIESYSCCCKLNVQV